MAVEPLREDMKASGASVLSLAERLGMYPLAAAWLYDHNVEEWRYYLVSPLVDIAGRKAVYDGLAKALSATKLGETVSIVDIYLAGIDDHAFRIIGACLKVGGSSGLEVRSCVFDGIQVDAFIYRFDSMNAEIKRDELKANFKRKVRQLVS